ncbi:HEAT repeat domain-containing protein [Salinibacterium sp. SWN248]|uniref:HEAT repeat domain-containing protein n=1 Tax=Salinibacterium sp. SWN248 TaxID=2792056 RepID=UPI0018CE978B|nr:HEAT repeat domain-containing protein [Salinibacterium sp. SWN248]MBH0024509.1 HEAT repeat domain-containing protein [Salinibacterium sp. SWN248]
MSEHDDPHAVDLELPIAARITAASERHGEAVIVERAVSLIEGNNEGKEFLLIVGGEHAQGILDGAPVLYWPELWGTRALLHAWNDSAADAVRAALSNQAWRVREMATRVVATRRLDAREQLLALLTDDTARVRASAARALGTVGSLDVVETLSELVKDEDIEVRRAAQQAVTAIRKRSPQE